MKSSQNSCKKSYQAPRSQARLTVTLRVGGRQAHVAVAQAIGAYCSECRCSPRSASSSRNSLTVPARAAGGDVAEGDRRRSRRPG